MPWRRAKPDDRATLDSLTLAGIRYSGHDQHHPEAYQALVDELAASDPPHLHPTWVLDDEAGIAGFYELREREDHVELLRMFLRTERIGQGHGRALWDHAVAVAATMSHRMKIVSDPGAVGFYAAMGAVPDHTIEPVTGFILTVFWYDLRAQPRTTKEPAAKDPNPC